MTGQAGDDPSGGGQRRGRHGHVGFLDEYKISVRDRVAEVAVPAAVACGVASIVALLVSGIVGETAGLALVLILIAVGGGILFAVVLKATSRRPDVADAQSLPARHPGWLRYGPVGGGGGLIGILGFLVIALLRGPMFLYVLAVVVPLGTITAFFLWRVRRRSIAEALTTLGGRSLRRG